MPLTWFAHQVPALGAKLARPRWFDATAMCVGSMMPDLMYSFSAYVRIDTHRWPASIIYGLPLTLIVATVTRFVIAPQALRYAPEFGPMRLRSFAVIAQRRPPIAITLLSAVLGIATHVWLDWFTHPGRPGPRWFGYDDLSVTIGSHTEPLAGVFQLFAHSFGSLAGVLLLWTVGRRRLLDEWYGVDAVDRARAPRATRRGTIVFWAIVGLGGLVGLVWGWPGEMVERVQRPAVGLYVGLAIASFTTTGRGRGSSTASSGRRRRQAV